MDIRINLSFFGPPEKLKDGIRLIEQAEANFLKKHPTCTRDDLWTLPVEATALIADAEEELAKVLPKKSVLFENILPGDPSIEEMETAAWFMVYGFADIGDITNAEITHHTDSIMECPNCGNRYQNPRFVPAIRPKKLPSRPILMTFYGPHKIFCRPKFIELYKQSGLTGISFIEWDEKDKKGLPLSLIHVEPHKWQDRAGVCSTCEMKTNATNSIGLFNMREHFKYDLQYIHVFDEKGGDMGTSFILSQTAVDFLLTVSGQMQTILEPPLTTITPIMPGYMEDVVWPEPRMCTSDKPPQYMLRSSWERKQP